MSGAENPVYAVAVIGTVALAAVPLGRIPFCRRLLATEDRTRLTPLDGLRGILCFAVMVHHALIMYLNAGEPDVGPYYTPAGHLYYLFGQTSVALFFSVTGFLFWSRVLARDGELDWRAFLTSRALRIGPMYLFSGLVTFAVVLAHVTLSRTQSASILATLLLLGTRQVDWHVPRSLLVDPVTWSLQYEWGFYVLLPGIAMLVRGSAGRLWSAAAGVLLVFGWGPAAYFAPGMLAAYVARDRALAERLRGRPAAVIALMAAFALPLLTAEGYGVLAWVPTTVLFLPIACGNGVFGLLTSRGLRLMGIVSYSVYLQHYVVLFLFRPLFLEAKLHRPVWQFWAEVVGCAVLTLGLSVATFRWVEWPFIVLERRLRRTPTQHLVPQPTHTAAAT